MAWRFAGAVGGLLSLGLAGCSSTIGLYHSVEGGAIGQVLQPPPGADQPYPNLAGVPAAPVALSPAQQAVVHARLAGAVPDVQGPAPGALAGLELPDAPPPPPPVGMEPAAPAAEAPAPTAAVAAPGVAQPPDSAPDSTADSAPVSLAFERGSAVLNPVAATALSGLAAAPHGDGAFLVAGFGEGSGATALALGLARAQRLADGLTASGVPPAEIKLLAAAAGSGGFVQIVY
jgi:outer membrane protein OmpA-like peptidoglycan-associated protein